MLQTLLSERFGLKLHIEKKNFDGFVLTVAKAGPRLTPALPPNGEAAPMLRAASAVARDAQGFPELPPGASRQMCRSSAGAMHCTYKANSMKDFSAGLKYELGMEVGGRLDSTITVIDRTELPGAYDFHLEFTAPRVSMTGAPPSPPSEPSGFPNIPGAVEKQLGLHLEPTKLSKDFLVIDHIEKIPTAN